MTTENKTAVETTETTVKAPKQKAPITLKDYLLFAFAIISFVAIISLIVILY